MARNTDLSSVLFKVGMQPVYTKRQTTQNVGGLEAQETGDNGFHRIPDFMAVVDVERQHTFAVVSPQYRLVTNEEAVRLGRDCLRQVLSQATIEGIEVFNIIMPKTRSFCHIDFMRQRGTIEPWSGDRWQPFLRVTNSYNRMKPLRFDIGFCRWICENGMIFGRESIQVRYYHTTNAIVPDGVFRIDAGRLKKVEAQFIERLHNLKRFYVPENCMFDIVCKAFGIRITAQDRAKPQRWQSLLEFRDVVAKHTKRHFSELGPNGYAALNVLTECATRPCLYISAESMIHSLQAHSGAWMDEFLRLISDPAFKFDTYLGDYLGQWEALSA